MINKIDIAQQRLKPLPYLSLLIDGCIEKGMDVKYEDILADVIKRDYNDSHREIAPLKPADDSVIADTSELTFDESVELLHNIVLEKMN